MQVIDEPTCLWKSIATAPDRCQFVRTYCEGNSVLNFYDIYFCSLNQNNFIFVPLAVGLTN